MPRAPVGFSESTSSAARSKPSSRYRSSAMLQQHARQTPAAVLLAGADLGDVRLADAGRLGDGVVLAALDVRRDRAVRVTREQAERGPEGPAVGDPLTPHLRIPRREAVVPDERPVVRFANLVVVDPVPGVQRVAVRKLGGRRTPSLLEVRQHHERPTLRAQPCALEDRGQVGVVGQSHCP